MNKTMKNTKNHFHNIEEDQNVIDTNSHLINCKHCKTVINLKRTKKLPKKLIIEKYGLFWSGIEKTYLIIFRNN